jgi:dihydrofolate reductase
MTLSLLVAMAKNGVIGHKNKLPWHLPEDLKRFRALTLGKVVMMGRKTHESIGRLLPGRENWVLTRQHNYKGYEGARVFGSLDEAMLQIDSSSDQEVFVIGGAEIYALALPKVNRIYLTEIDGEFEGDARMDSNWVKDFKIVSLEERTEPFTFRFKLFERTI